MLSYPSDVHPHQLIWRKFLLSREGSSAGTQVSVRVPEAKRIVRVSAASSARCLNRVLVRAKVTSIPLLRTSHCVKSCPHQENYHALLYLHPGTDWTLRGLDDRYRSLGTGLRMKAFLVLGCLCVVASMPFSQMAMAREEEAVCNGKHLYIRMADASLNIWNSTGPGKEQWNYERGVLLYGISRVWRKTKIKKYLDFIIDRTDAFVTENGSIPTFKKEDYNLDNIRSGVNLLFLYRETGLQKYKIAADLLQEQLKAQPRTNEGGYWHKFTYPYQMWLDGLFMAQPFRAEYARMFDKHEDFEDIALQHIRMEKHARDPKLGLLYHGWDESKQQAWANKVTGTSPSFWGRAIGWYAMSLVDTLDFFPVHHPRRNELIQILSRLAKALVDFQDEESGVWWQVVDQGRRAGNYLESSASSCYAYALAKGVHNGYLQPHYYKAALLAYEGIEKQFVEGRPDGGINLTGTVSVGGLGGCHPYRNGTYEYYISEKVVTNDAKGVGPFLLASVEFSQRGRDELMLG